MAWIAGYGFAAPDGQRTALPTGHLDYPYGEPDTGTRGVLA